MPMMKKFQVFWSTVKKGLVLMSLWGLVYSVVSIAKLGVAFDYDDTLVTSSAAYEKAYAASPLPFGPQFWSVLNRSYDLERPKLVGNAIAWFFRVCGFRVSIVASRPDVDGEALKKEWRRLAPARFIFVGEKGDKQKLLESGNFVLFFGPRDSDITQAKKAKILALRVLRHPKSPFKEDYHPGKLGELIVPLSQY